MQPKNDSRFGRTTVAVLLVTCASALACSRAAEPASTAPAAPPPPPALEPSAPAAAEQAAPEMPAAAPAPEPAGPRDLLDEDREERKDHAAANSSGQPFPDDLETAQADLERARIALNQALAPERSRPASKPAPTGGASRGAAAAAPPAKADKKSEESSCTTACNAFSSLERAAGAVCRITGEKDGRCGHAHAVLADAQKRVAVCSCSAG